MAEERGPAYYLAPIRKHTLLILSLALLALIGSSISWFRSLQNLPYQAEAIIMFRPNNGGQLNLSTGQFSNTGIDFVRQQQNVGLLATSMEIAKQVAQDANKSTDPEIKALGAAGALALHDKVSVETRGNFLALKATASTADAATWLANTWADAAVQSVNSIYASPSPNVQQAIDDVKTKLDKDQAALQQYMANDPTFDLRAEMSRTVGFIQSAIASDSTTEFMLYDALAESTRNQIRDAYDASRTVDQQLSDLAVLRNKIQTGPDDQATLFGNQVALLTAVNQVASGNANTGVQMQLSTADLGKNPLTKSSQLSDVDATIAAVQKLQTDLGTKIAGLQEKLASLSTNATPRPSTETSPAVQQYLERYKQLQSQLEAKTFELNTLTKTRDQDQSTYDLLRNRLAEQQVNQLVSGLIDVGSPANESQTAQARSPLRSLALVTGQWVLLAIAIGCGIAFLLGILSPEFNSNTFVRNGFRKSPRTRLSGGSSQAN